MIYGGDDEVPFSREGYHIAKPLYGVEYYKPSKSLFAKILAEMENGDELYFWGHGAGGGKIWINDNDVIRKKDIELIMKLRKADGKGKIHLANLHSCFTADSMDALKMWFLVAEEVWAYCGLTAGTSPYRINPQSKYRPLPSRTVDRLPMPKRTDVWPRN